jgi:hypothetical protein
VWNLQRLEQRPAIFSGSESVINSVAFSPDGLRLAAGGVDRVVRMWDLRTPEAPPVRFDGHESDILSVVFSPDGSRLAAGGFDGLCEPGISGLPPGIISAPGCGVIFLPMNGASTSAKIFPTKKLALLLLRVIGNRAMYSPVEFKEEDLVKLHDFIQEYNFAVLISMNDGRCSVSHLPLLLDKTRGQFGTLIGHMARANSQWKELESAEVTCVFNGPHGYISPSWYANSLNVPTWNYAVVHTRDGRP